MPHNIILFLTDQWRWDTLNDSESPARLPNLDEFRGSATNFVNAFSPVPLCTPARASLFTGKWPHQTGTMDNVQGRSYYPLGCLHPDQITYLQRLRDADYDIAYIGKWHLGDGGLIARGITDVLYSDGGDEPIGTSTPEMKYDEELLSPYYGTVTAGELHDGIRVDAAIDRITELSTRTKPFCLVVSLHGPHFPHHVPKEFVDLYADLPEDYVPANFSPQFTETNKPEAQSRSYWPCQETGKLSPSDWRKTAQHYFGFCSYLDAQFGRIVKAIEDQELRENTVLAFTSDHGEMLGAHGWFDKGPFFYDEVMRIPMLIRTPNLKQSAENEYFVSLKDLWPTLADAAGIASMLEPDEVRCSYNQSQKSWVTYCYDSYQGRQFKIRGIRDKRYKYAWSPNDLAELYDLQTDPGERTNLVDKPEYSTIQTDLHDRLMTWMEEELDYLRVPIHHLPIGSYADGRALSYDPDNIIPGR